MHFLYMCHVNPKVVFLGVRWYKGWLVILSRDLSSDAEDGSSRSVFSSERTLQVTRCDAGGLHFLRVLYKMTALPKHGYFS